MLIDDRKHMYQTDTHLMASFPAQPGQAGTRKIKPVWVLKKQEMMAGSGISWTMCKSFAPSSIQITLPAPHHSIFVQAGCSSQFFFSFSDYYNNL